MYGVAEYADHVIARSVSLYALPRPEIDNHLEASLLPVVTRPERLHGVRYVAAHLTRQNENQRPVPVE